MFPFVYLEDKGVTFYLPSRGRVSSFVYLIEARLSFVYLLEKAVLRSVYLVEEGCFFAITL